MITLIIGVVITLLIFLIFGWYGFIPLVITALLLVLPIQGFYSPSAETMDIIKLNKGKYSKPLENTYYVYKNKNTVIYAHDVREKYNLPAEIYEEVKLRGKVKIFESEECKKPILKVYTKVTKRGDFTFAPFDVVEYVFFVPKGTVFYADNSVEGK